MKPEEERAIVMTIALYPYEKEALLQLAKENEFKSVFDSVRWLAEKADVRGFYLPKKRNANRKKVLTP